MPRRPRASYLARRAVSPSGRAARYASRCVGTGHMRATQLLHDLGQSLRLDNITRDLLDRGTLQRYIAELSVTGLTSTPKIFNNAIKPSVAYDEAIQADLADGRSGEALFFDL